MSHKSISNFTEIKAALVRKGSSLAQWAREHQYPVTTVHQAASGARAGKISLKILSKLLKEVAR